MKVHLVDGTYELFRQHFGMAVRHGDPAPNAAALGVVASTLQLVQQGATHLGVASDHVIESFRNDLYAGYKTSEGMEPVLLEQIPVMEHLLALAGFTVWPMVEHEADDALGSAAAAAEADQRVEQVLIVTPDKDLGQCVRGTRVVQYDRRKDEIIDEAAVTSTQLNAQANHVSLRSGLPELDISRWALSRVEIKPMPSPSPLR